MKEIKSVIFDLGGVLIDWNPRYLYRKILKDDEEVTWFLQNICTSEWNDQQDAGRSFEEATADLIKKHPQWKDPIAAWYGRWQETIRGPIHDTVDILRSLKDSKKYPLYALTNWSAETFPWARKNFDFLSWFDGIVVSGEENTRKPFPKMYQILFDRFTIEPSTSLFIDDNWANIEGAKAVGLQTIHFNSPKQLKEDLAKKGVIVP